MGQLVPGATYVYERVGPITYAREVGSNARHIAGIDFPTGEKVDWYDVVLEAQTNPALQNAVDRVIMLYKLSKEKL